MWRMCNRCRVQDSGYSRTGYCFHGETVRLAPSARIRASTMSIDCSGSGSDTYAACRQRSSPACSCTHRPVVSNFRGVDVRARVAERVGRGARKIHQPRWQDGVDVRQLAQAHDCGGAAEPVKNHELRAFKTRNQQKLTEILAPSTSTASSISGALFIASIATRGVHTRSEGI